MPKTTDDGIAVIQAETAAGAAIKHFRRGRGCAPRMLPADQVVLGPTHLERHLLARAQQSVPNESRRSSMTPLIELNDQFKKIAQLQEAFERIPNIFRARPCDRHGRRVLRRNVSLRAIVVDAYFMVVLMGDVLNEGAAY